MAKKQVNLHFMSFDTITFSAWVCFIPLNTFKHNFFLFLQSSTTVFCFVDSFVIVGEAKKREPLQTAERSIGQRPNGNDAPPRGCR